MTFPEEATPPDLRRQVLELQAEAWPDDGTSGKPVAEIEPTHDPALRPLSMLLVDDGAVVAALDILSKELVHAGERYRAGGLSTVVTRRTSQRQGHGHRLVRAARSVMAGDLDTDMAGAPAASFDLGLFTCDTPLQAFYESAGWQRLPGAVLVGGTPAAPFPSDQPGFDKVTMAAFFSDHGRRGRASFEESRIELFPGEIDKLW